MEKPESAAFLQIWEKKPADEKPKWVFSGWMFASNPSLSAMDHPVYDVWVINCKSDVAPLKAQEFSSEKTPEGAPDKPVAPEKPSAPEAVNAGTGTVPAPAAKDGPAEENPGAEVGD